LLGAVVAHLALLGYLYGVPDLYAIKPFNSVALHTAVALGVLGLGIILARPQRGIVRVVSSDSPGGMLARRLLPAAVAAPAALALALQWGEHAGLYGGGFGRAMLVLCSTVLFAVLIWGTAAALTHVDQRRRAAEDDVRTSEARKTVLLAELVRSSDRLRVLSQVSDAFAAVATSYQALIDQVARTVAKIVGDGCMVTLLSDDGERLFNAANAHRDPALESDYKAYLAGLSLPVATSTAIAAAVVRTGQPRRADVQPDAIVAHSDDALKPVVARLNIHGFAVVAIRVRHAVIGTLSVQRSEPNRSYTDDDVTLLQDLADRAGLAIENARLYGQLEQRVRERTRELEIANGELEAFSYSVAHDLRAPLRGIAGFSRTVIEDYADRLPADGVGHLTRIEAGAQRMALLIDDLLDLARVSRAQLRSSRVDLSAMARTAIARLQAEQPVRNVEIVVEDGLVAQADPGLLDIALTNLLDNAWKFTGKRARARIELAACADQRPRTFFIRDNGAGFEAKYAAKLFGVFERLHPANEFEGTGIGLAIARRIIDRHGGRIWAESTVGEGATFFFTLETAVASDARQ
jgi:signal transduction histidine kinase